MPPLSRRNTSSYAEGELSYTDIRLCVKAHSRALPDDIQSVVRVRVAGHQCGHTEIFKL